MSRVRVVVGIRRRLNSLVPSSIMQALAVVAMAVSVACPQAASAQSQLVTATIGGWTTTLNYDAPHGGTAAYSDSKLIAPLTLPAHGSAWIQDIAGWQTKRGFGSIALSDESVNASSTLDYGTTEFTIPALRFSLTANGQRGEIPAIVNAGSTGAFFIFLNISSTPAAVTLKFYDAGNALINTETATAYSGITPYTAATTVRGGRVEIVEGYEHFNSPPDATLYAVACMGPASGASQRCEVMRAIQ